MYVELKFYRSSDMFKVVSEEYLSVPLKTLNKSPPCNSKCWKKDIGFFSKIRVTCIVKSAKREADKASNKAERFVKIFD